jgi:hypothetical protein
VINRQDGKGTDTPEKMEYVSYTGVLAKSLTGLARALGGTTAKDHGSGSIVECFLTAKYWEDMVDFIGADHDSAGKTLITSHVRSFQATGVSGASGIKGGLVLVPFSGVSIYATSGASGYGVVNLTRIAEDGGIVLSGVVNDISTGGYRTGIHLLEHNETIKSFSLILSAPASEATMTIDAFKNNTSIFTLKPIITQGGTYVSTASLSTTSLKSGDYIHLTFS